MAYKDSQSSLPHENRFLIYCAKYSLSQLQMIVRAVLEAWLLCGKSLHFRLVCQGPRSVSKLFLPDWVIMDSRIRQKRGSSRVGRSPPPVGFLLTNQSQALLLLSRGRWASTWESHSRYHLFCPCLINALHIFLWKLQTVSAAWRRWLRRRGEKPWAYSGCSRLRSPNNLQTLLLDQREGDKWS